MQIIQPNLDADERYLQQKFPGLAGNFKKTSPKTDDYNCLAWALGLNHPWIDATHNPGTYWPADVPDDWSITTAREILAKSGFTEVATIQDLEPDWEKVAIFGKGGDDLQHFARQLPSGKWTSKMGMQIDIEHDDLDCLKGNIYGEWRLIVKRRRNINV